MIELLESLGDVSSEFLRVSSNGHNTSFSGLSQSLQERQHDFVERLGILQVAKVSGSRDPPLQFFSLSR